jgi:hypothetical protein
VRALALALLLAGCASPVRLDGPRTLPPGQRSTYLAPSAYLNGSNDMSFNLDALFRLGVSDRVDVGLRLDSIGAQADAKVMLVRGSDPRLGIYLSVSPSLGVGLDAAWGRPQVLPWAGTAGVALMLGVNLGDWRLALSPQIVYARVPVLPAGLLSAGGTISFGRIDGPGVRIYPAVALWRWAEARHPDELRHGQVVVQPALVVRWGK